MAGPSLPAPLAGALSSLAGKLPFLPKKKQGGSGVHEPFEDLEDPSPESDESFEPNALPGGKTVDAKKAGIDLGALVQAFLGNRVLLVVVSAVLVTVLGMALASILSQAEPPPSPVHAQPVTEEGRAAARRFLLPPDPALDLSPPMEREPLLRYTEAEMLRQSAVHDPQDLPTLIRKNDARMEALLEAAR